MESAQSGLEPGIFSLSPWFGSFLGYLFLGSNFHSHLRPKGHLQFSCPSFRPRDTCFPRKLLHGTVLRLPRAAMISVG